MIEVTVNGTLRRAEAEPRLLLSDFLRHTLGLTGTHVGCEHGVCGACTVRLDGKAVRSCLLFAVQADGLEVETVEGLEWGLLQDAFRRHHALQCGFCTPGILITATDLLARGKPSRDGDRGGALRQPLPLHRATRRSSTRSRRSRAREPRPLAARRVRAPSRRGGAPRLHVRAPARRGGADRGRARRSTAGSGSRSCSTTASRRRSSTGRRSGPASSSSRSRGGSPRPELDYCIGDCGAQARAARGRPAPRRRRAPGRARPRRAGAEPDALHVGHDGPARRASRARTAPTAPAGSRRRSSTATARATGRSA